MQMTSIYYNIAHCKEEISVKHCLHNGTEVVKCEFSKK